MKLWGNYSASSSSFATEWEKTTRINLLTRQFVCREEWNMLMLDPLTNYPSSQSVTQAVSWWRWWRWMMMTVDDDVSIRQINSLDFSSRQATTWQTNERRLRRSFIIISVAGNKYCSRTRTREWETINVIADRARFNSIKTQFQLTLKLTLGTTRVECRRGRRKRRGKREDKNCRRRNIQFGTWRNNK